MYFTYVLNAEKKCIRPRNKQEQTCDKSPSMRI